MASLSARGAKGHHTYTLTLTETATSVANNNSTVSFSFDLTDDANWFWEEWNTSISYSVSAAGSVIASGSIPNHTTKSQNLAKGTITVPHSADGTKTIAYSFTVTDGANQYYTSGNASASGTMTLSTIPRATTPTFSAKSVTMGSSITITMTPAASTFKHKLRYSWSTLTQQTSGFSAGNDFTAQGTTTATFTPPTSLANYIPSATSGVCTVQCYTYDASGNHIGTVNTDITLAVPSYNPTGTITITGNNLLSSTYVQGKSTMGVSITGSTSYGASITGYSSVVDGKTYSGNAFTTSTLGNGSKSVVTTITDSRGKTASVTSSSVTVYEYAPPQITSFSLVRQSDNTTVIATVQGTISSVNSKNAKTVKVVLNGVTNTITASSYTISGTTTFTSVPTETTLIGSATLTDSYTTVKQDSMLPTVAVTMDFYKDGKGVAFGKVAETSDLLDVAWSERVRKNLTVDGTLSATGNATLKGTLGVTGATTLSSTLGVTGNTTVGGTLGVTGAATFSKAASVTDDVIGLLTIKRNHASNAAAVKFQNNTTVLGYIGMTGSASNAEAKRWDTNTSVAYTLLDTGNLTNTIKDYIVETGTSGIWTYRKWNSGVAECWGIYTMASSCTLAWGSLYYSNKTCSRINYPFTFTARPQEMVSLRLDAYSGWIYADSEGKGMNTTTQTAVYGFLRPSTMGETTIRYEFYVIGKWK